MTDYSDGLQSRITVMDYRARVRSRVDITVSVIVRLRTRAIGLRLGL